MAAPAQDEFDVLDQLIVRSLVTLRLARAACRTGPTVKNLTLAESAEENLNALLDFRAEAGQRAALRRMPVSP